VLPGTLALSSPDVSGARFEKPEVPLAPARSKINFESEIVPLLTRYCYGCHGEKKKGDLDLRIYQDRATVLRDKQVFAKVMKNLQAHEMPPEKKPQPTPDERELIASWIQAELFPCDCEHPDPGRVTLRRLNRAEYKNTVRDLLGVDFHPAEDFPADDVGYGFDNIGDVLSMPPILIEKYMAAAAKVLDLAIPSESMLKKLTNRFEAVGLDGTAPGNPTSENMRLLAREGDIHLTFNFPREGEYILRARAYGEQAGPDPARMAFSIDGKETKRFDVTAVQSGPAIYEARVALSAGKKVFGAAYLNNYVNPKDPDPKNRDRNLVIDYLEIVAPEPKDPPTMPESQRRIFVCRPGPGQERECERVILGGFARRAYRRPVSADEVERLVDLADEAREKEKSFEIGVQVALQAVLVSPHFLFRGELPQRVGAVGKVARNSKRDLGGTPVLLPISEHALASRLSYFLWSSMPDDELCAQADRGTLRKNLPGEIRRMLKDPKARALVENFGDQWLQIRNLSQIAPDKAAYPDFDDDLRAAMQQETELFFEAIAREDRSVLDFLDAKYTYVNERLARHYGLKGIRGPAFQRVSLQGAQRGGVLTHASILTVTSNPTRTSPVKRGKWVLDNLLGTPPPPPPPDVPQLDEGKRAVLTGSLRQRMEQHRAKTLCASCHARMDPIGFGLENYDGIGAWREKDGNFPVDPAGQLVTGESFQGVKDLKTILWKRKKDDFVRCLSEKMLTYALGRGLEYYDRCAVEQITKGLARNQYKFSALVVEIARSTPFQMRR